MNWKEEYKPFLWISGFFLFAYFMPISNFEFKEAILSAFELTKWYAQEHVLLCLVPAFFIAGVIAVFVSQAYADQVSLVRIQSPRQVFAVALDNSHRQPGQGPFFNQAEQFVAIQFLPAATFKIRR